MNSPVLQILIDDASKRKRSYQWGEVVQGLKVYACHQKQLDVINSTAKFTFAFAGTGGGKTCIIPLWISRQLRRLYRAGKRAPRILVVSPSVPIFESSELKRHILQTFSDTPYGTQDGWNDSKKTYKLRSGGEIIVKTCGDGGDYQKLTGGQYDAVVADEVYFLSGEVWNEIRRRGGAGDCPILCVTTPNANNWIFDIKQQADKGNKDYAIYQWGSGSNPTYSKEHLERERALMSEATYARMYEGQFSAAEGLIYSVFADPNDSIYPVIEGDPKKGLPSPPVRFFGCNDWGYNPDPASMMIVAECEDGIMYVVDEIYGTKITPDDLANKARAMIDRWAVRVDSKYADAVTGGRFTTFWSDVSRPELLQSFRKAGIPIRNKRVTDVLAGIANTDKWFRSGRLKVYSTCPNLIREMRGYQWSNDRKGDLKDKPLGKNDHTCDALRYGISSHKYGVDPSPIVRPVLNEEIELEKLDRMGLLDAAGADAALKERDKQLENEWYVRMLMAGTDD